MPSKLTRSGLAMAVVSLLGCTSSPDGSQGRNTWQADLCTRLKYRIPFETRGKDRSGEDSIEILEVIGTRPSIEVGGEYVVRGRYRLSSFDRGRVVLWETENGGPGTLSYDVDLQAVNVDRGQGTFTLLHAVPVDGWLHVVLHGTTGTSPTELCNVYFGSGKSLDSYAVPSSH